MLLHSKAVRRERKKKRIPRNKSIANRRCADATQEYKERVQRRSGIRCWHWSRSISLLTQCRLLFCSRFICTHQSGGGKLYQTRAQPTRYQRQTAGNRCGLNKGGGIRNRLINQGNVHLLLFLFFFKDLFLTSMEFFFLLLDTMESGN